jgi:hypothetical protein
MNSLLTITSKQRMLNAYKGIYSDLIPVAPEFWFFYPAKVLGISMAEFQREIPHWKGLLETFRKFDSDGWGIVGADIINPHMETESEYRKIADKTYRDFRKIRCDGNIYTSSYLFIDSNPFWIENYPVKSPNNIEPYMKSMLSADVQYDFTKAREGYNKVGETFLLEFALGPSFFDLFEEAMGFENAALYLLTGDETEIKYYFDMYLETQKQLVREAVKNTDFEAFFIGCSSACNSLEGVKLWRKWDKPYLREITQEIHRYGKLIHNHNHGKIMQTVPDLAEIGFDCVCPFERAPGDINGIEGLVEVRRLLCDKVTFNGNVHTVQALAKGTPKIVKEQVREIKEAFKGSPRLIIGTGDQVAGETPEENIFAMIEEGRKT